METIRNLIDVLESEFALYEELLELLISEKKIITEWDIDKVVEITKIKDTLLYKEKLLEEAREKIINKISNKNEKEMSLTNIIDELNDEMEKEKLLELKNNISNVITKIQMETFAVKLLYNTNMKIIGDIFERAGLTEKAGYQSQGKPEQRKNNSFVSSA